MTAPLLAPGPYTLRWQIDVRDAPRTPLLRLAQLAAFAVQPRFGELQGTPPQPSDAEAIINPVTQDTLTGVLRVRLSRETHTRELGAAILAAIRSVEPTAVEHIGTGVAVGPATVPLAVFAVPLVALAAAVRAIPGADRAVSARVGSVIIEARPGIDATARPLAASNPVSGLLVAGSRRQSADPARDGNLGAQGAREAARAVGEAVALSPGAVVAIVAVSTAVLAVVGYVAYRRILG